MRPYFYLPGGSRLKPTTEFPWRLCGSVLTLLCCVLPATYSAGQTPAPVDWEAERRVLDDDWRQALARLAAQCDSLALPEQAERTRQWLEPRRTGAALLFVPGAGEAALKGAPAERVQQWQAALQRARKKHAAALYPLAERAAQTSDTAAAVFGYRLLWEVLRADPEHAGARRILGWAPPATALTAAPVTVVHPRFGWQPRRYWRLTTPHYELITNHSPKAALACGEELERLHLLWRQAFFAYWCEPATLAAAARGTAVLHPDRPRMKVVLFNHRQEYIEQLGRAIPGVEVSLGYYDGAQRTAYFFAGDESVHPTWRHEGAHQLFQEYVRGVETPGLSQNFWLVEGAALYLESLQPLGDASEATAWSVGGWESDRLQFARYRALTGDFRLPLGQAVKMGRDSVQQHPEIRKLYTQFAGLSHFLLDSPASARRAAGAALLAQIYRGDDDAGSLERLTNTTLAELDADYLGWLKVTDDDLRSTPAASRLRNLSLAGCPVSDRGLADLRANLGDLVWADLSRTAVTDAGLAILARTPRLKQLFLDGAQVTGKSLPRIAECAELEELDLSNLPLTAADLAPLTRLKRLKVVYFQHCPLGDDAVDTLRKFGSVQQLDLTGCRLSPAGLARLRAALPRVKIDGE